MKEREPEMFNTIINSNSRTEYVPYTKTINIGRAPTDESIKLLKEMEKAALNKLVEVIKVENNVFNFVCHVFLTPRTLGYEIVVRYKINGNEYEFSDKLPTKFDASANKDEHVKLIYELIIKNFSKKLSELVTIDIIRNDTHVLEY